MSFSMFKPAPEKDSSIPISASNGATSGAASVSLSVFISPHAAERLLGGKSKSDLTDPTTIYARLYFVTDRGLV
jgi:hypothetical protein